MTASEYQTLLENCNFDSPDAVSELVTSTHTNVAFNEKVEERQINNAVSSYNYFSGFFGKEVWQDGQGMDLVREYFTDPHIPFTFSHFVQQSAICDPNLANECSTTYCEIPKGGRGTLPGQVFFKWGFKTERDCIANIRHIRAFQYWAKKVIRARELVDDRVMNIFYVMAAIRTAGHKIVLQGTRNSDGNLTLAPNSNPRNPMRGGYYNYMEEKFPQPTDLETIVPLTADSLQDMAQYFQTFGTGNAVAKGPRGEDIFEFWHPDDWYYAEAIRDPEMMEKLKITLPHTLFAGTRLMEGQREIIGNFAAKTMPWLPRFAPTSDGRIIPVDSHVGLDIEVGKEYVGSIDFQNAPIGLAVIPSGKQGTILTRPALTQSGAGFPIQAITGNGPWVIRNDYDKDCNADLNQPYSQKRVEMGFRMDAPNGTAILFRRRKFAARPINECDLAPMFFAESNEVSCELTTIGCGDNQRRVNDNIISDLGANYVSCTAAACGNGVGAPFHYIVKVDRKAGNPGFNNLDCACGSNVKLFIYDLNGDFDREIIGIYKSDAGAKHEARIFVETQEAIGANKCIKGISCADDTRFQGNAIDAWDIEVEEGEDAQVSFILDDSIACEEGDAVEVRYYDANGTVLGVIYGVVEEFDTDRFYYRISSSDALFKAEEAYAGQASIGVSCNEDPNSSSSSSSSGA